MPGTSVLLSCHLYLSVYFECFWFVGAGSLVACAAWSTGASPVPIMTPTITLTLPDPGGKQRLRYRSLTMVVSNDYVIAP